MVIALSFTLESPFQVGAHKMAEQPRGRVSTTTVSTKIGQDVYVVGGSVIINGLINFAWDYVAVTYPSGTQEVYTFKTGGSGGTTVGTITVNYTDSTKASLLNAARS